MNIFNISLILEMADDIEAETNVRPETVEMSQETFDLIVRVMREKSVLQPWHSYETIPQVSMIYRMPIVINEELILGDFKLKTSPLLKFYKKNLGELADEH